MMIIIIILKPTILVHQSKAHHPISGTQVGKGLTMQDTMACDESCGRVY